MALAQNDRDGAVNVVMLSLHNVRWIWRTDMVGASNGTGNEEKRGAEEGSRGDYLGYHTMRSDPLSSLPLPFPSLVSDTFLLFRSVVCSHISKLSHLRSPCRCKAPIVQLSDDQHHEEPKEPTRNNLSRPTHTDNIMRYNERRSR